MFPDGAYAEERLLLEPGDTLVVYTDGVTEAQDNRGREFGEERLTDVVRAQMSLPPARLQEHLLASVREFAGDTPIRDDLTLLLLRGVE